MPKKKTDTLADQLRAAIEESGLTAYRIGIETGLPAPTISRFLNNERDLTLGTADRIAAYLGLRLVRAER